MGDAINRKRMPGLFQMLLKQFSIMAIRISGIVRQSLLQTQVFAEMSYEILVETQCFVFFCKNNVFFILSSDYQESIMLIFDAFRRNATYHRVL